MPGQLQARAVVVQHPTFSPSDRLDPIPPLKLSLSAQNIFHRKVNVPDQLNADFIPRVMRSFKVVVDRTKAFAIQWSLPVEHISDIGVISLKRAL
jgi:hypothetical protein